MLIMFMFIIIIIIIIVGLGPGNVDERAFKTTHTLLFLLISRPHKPGQFGREGF